MEDNLTLVSMGWISERSRLPLTKIKGKYMPNAPSKLKRGYKPNVLHMMKFEVAEELGRERALKIWKFLRTGLENQGAHISYILNVGSDSIENYSEKRLTCTTNGKCSAF